MAWSWSFVPQRLIADERFLELSMPARGVLYGLYHRADRWGRGPGDKMSLRVLLGIVDGYDATPALEQIGAAGLASVYVLDGRRYWQLERYDEDCPADMIRKRTGTSTFPPPPPPTDPASTGQRPPTDASGPASSRSGAAVSGPLPAISASHPENAGSHPPDSGQHPATAASCRTPGAQDETRLDETRTRSSQEGGSVAPRAPTPAPARGPAHEAPSVPDVHPEQARPAAPSSRPELVAALPLPPPATSATPTAWPPGAEEAAARWWGRLAQERPGPFGSGGYSLADLQRIALEHPDDFAAAVDEHVGGVRGWKRTDPFAWLRRQCVFVAERRADARARSPARSPPDELPAIRKPYEPYRGWNWRWDTLAPDTPGLDPAWPSALDLPPDQHEALAWCTHTPDGPVVPPQRLADVPGALEAYRQARVQEAAA